MPQFSRRVIITSFRTDCLARMTLSTFFWSALFYTDKGIKTHSQTKPEDMWLKNELVSLRM
jgi:hypothetical protein